MEVVGLQNRRREGLVVGAVGEGGLNRPWVVKAGEGVRRLRAEEAEGARLSLVEEGEGVRCRLVVEGRLLRLAEGGAVRSVGRVASR